MHSQHTHDANKALVRRMFEELWNQGNLDVVEELFSPSYAGHDPTDPNPGTRETHGHEDIRAFVRMFQTAAPDLRFTVEDTIAEGDKVIAQWTATGTQRGDLLGLPPTGRRVRVEGVTIYRIADGKIQEGWQNWDALGLLRQLGAVTDPLHPD